MNEVNRTSDNFMIDESSIPFIEYICNGMPGGFFTYYDSGDGEIIYVNKAMQRIFGCDTEEELRELIHNSFKGMVHPDDYERVDSSIRKQIIENPYGLDYVEYRIIRKDGSVRWVEDYGRHLNTSKGDIFYVFIEDATERMRERMDELERVNKELKSAYSREVQYKKAILHNAAASFEVNLTKDEFIYTNNPKDCINSRDLFEFMETPSFTRFSDFISYRAKKMNQKKSEEYKSFFSTGRLIECYEKGEPEQTYESYMIEASGIKRFLNYLILIGKNELTEELIAFVVIRDVSAAAAKKKRFQATLSEVNAQNIARQAFLASLANDLKVPLSSIRSFAEMISYNSSNESIQKYCLEKIEASSNELLDIINESLNISYMESQSEVLSRSECNISDLLEDIKQRVFADASEKQINFYIEKCDLNSPNVYVDNIRLEEAIWQLIDNAVKFTDSGGTVTLKASEVESNAKGYGAYVFEVIDTGIGIDSVTLEHIFEPKKHKSLSEYNNIKGNGLGLAVVKNIVDMMKGSVTAESTAGEGSRFKIELLLPLQNCRSLFEPSERPIDKSVMEGKRILVVEDNEITLEIERTVLENCGCIVDIADNGLEAVEKVSEQTDDPYDLILMDIHMPIMNGYEATGVIRRFENPRLSKIPIIAVTASTYEEVREDIYKAGMNGYFPEPIDITALQLKIAEVLGL